MTTIAVVDDDSTLLDLMAELLRARNWTMLPLQDVSSVVDSIRREDPDAILLDIRLGGTHSGWDVLQELQEAADTRTIPVIIWSGDASVVGEKREWLRGRHIPILSKPFDIDNLYLSLEEVLASHIVPRPNSSRVSA